MRKNFMMTECVYCHKEVPYGKFCAECGKPQVNEVVEKTAIKCSSCKRDVFAGKYCSACGASLKNKSDVM